MTSQAKRDVFGRSVEYSDLTIVTANLSFRERRREIRDAVVKRRHEIHGVGTAGARVVEGVAPARVRLNGVEWTSTVGPDAVQNDPGAANRIHVLQTRTNNSAGDLLLGGEKRDLQQQQARETTY